MAAPNEPPYGSTSTSTTVMMLACCSIQYLLNRSRDTINASRVRRLVKFIDLQKEENMYLRDEIVSVYLLMI